MRFIALILFFSLSAFANKDLCQFREAVAKTPREVMQKFLRLGASSPEELKASATALEKMDPKVLAKWMELAESMLKTHLDDARVRGNLEHVYAQHLAALDRDAAELSELFGIDPKVLRLMMMVHDLGKVKEPPMLSRILADIKPDLFKKDEVPAYLMFLLSPGAKSVLAHEYGSMYWTQLLGHSAGASPTEIEALQRLIANHNFGIDMTDPASSPVKDHFWPQAFRNVIIPAFQHLGYDVGGFPIGISGRRDYGRNKNIYSDLLSLYDRMAAQPVASAHPVLGRVLPGGLANLKKFELEQKAFNKFNGYELSLRLRSNLAQWEREYVAVWRQAYTHVPPGRERPVIFGPQMRQLKALQQCDTVISEIESVNRDFKQTAADGKTGYAYYRRPDQKTLFRIEWERGGTPKVAMSTDKGVSWNYEFPGHQQMQAGDPYTIFFKLIEQDIRWDHPEQWSPFRRGQNPPS